MNSNMLHRGPMDRLTTFTNLPVLSTCAFLLIQFQIFHALPTSYSTTSLDSTFSQADIPAGLYQSSPSTSYGPAYSYNSYRPGLTVDSYRPHAYQQKSISENKGEVAPHPNSIYSSQTSASAPSTSPTTTPEEDFVRVLKFLESQMTERNAREFGATGKKVTTTEESSSSSSPKTIDHAQPTTQNKPRLLRPLPSTGHEDKNAGEHPITQSADSEEQRRSVDLPFPPPFAPELDPQFERRKSGLGPISLLDQVGPFW